MRSLPDILKHALYMQAPSFLYFFLAFNILGFTRQLLLREHGIRVSTFAAATFGALLISRVILIAEHLPFMNPFSRLPVIYNAAWKALCYWVLGFAAQLVKAAVFTLYQLGSLAPTLDLLGSPRFWVIQMWIILLFLAYFTFRELARAIGLDRTREILLGPRSLHPSAHPKKPPPDP